MLVMMHIHVTESCDVSKIILPNYPVHHNPRQICQRFRVMYKILIYLFSKIYCCLPLSQVRLVSMENDHTDPDR